MKPGASDVLNLLDCLYGMGQDVVGEHDSLYMVAALQNAMRDALNAWTNIFVDYKYAEVQLVRDRPGHYTIQFDSVTTRRFTDILNA